VGRHVTTWDGHDSNGSQVHTGVYFYRMTAPGYTSQAKKMLLLK
jgi:flagellar hook assembly protein FlgD